MWLPSCLVNTQRDASVALFTLLILNIKNMKILDANRKYENTYESKEIRFAISKKEQKHIMSMLRDQIYSDKMLAPIREYFCNAADANIEAGNESKSIDIKLPDTIINTWSVRDYGPGLTHEEIKNIFTKYGESTKRDSNSVTGCLGIGSKSAFAYTDQFTIETWQNNTKRTYVAAINNNGDAVVHLANTQQSDKENGTRITLPIKKNDVSQFRNKTSTYLESISHAGTKYNILNDDFEETEVPIIYEGDKENWYIINSARTKHWDNQRGDARVVMGHVAYPLDTNQLDSLDTDSQSMVYCESLYIKVPLGTLSIAASREALEYNSQTLSYLKSELPKIREDVQNVICNKIINADNLFEATKLFNSAEQELPYSLKKVLNNLRHSSGKRVSGQLKFTKTENSTTHPLNVVHYTWRTLRTGTRQIRRSDTQYSRPNLKTTCFINDKSETKGKVGRRVRAFMEKDEMNEVMLIHHTRKELENSTISDFSDNIPSISTIEPVPINYTSASKGSKGPSKAKGELFIINLDKIGGNKRVNRDLFEITDEETALETVDQLYSIQINGFTYAGKDAIYGCKEEYPDQTRMLESLAHLLKNRYGISFNLVAYRPKHEESFQHIPSFFDTIISKIEEEFTLNPDFAWEMMLHRTPMLDDVANADNIRHYYSSHHMDKLLKHLTFSKRRHLKYLSTLWEKHRELNKDKQVTFLNACLNLLKIKPDGFTRKTIPDIEKLTIKALDEQPILRYIFCPNEYTWGDNDEVESIKDKFTKTLRQYIK